MQFAVGIDLGTTYSCVGVFRDNGIEIIPNECGDYTTPSCVAFTEHGRFIGSEAQNKTASSSSNTIFDIKRLIGRRFEDQEVRIERKRLPYHIIRVSGRPAVQVKFKGDTKVFSPEEVSAMILAKLKAMAEQHLGLAPGSHLKCVITVPSAFNIFQRQSTKNACEIAGLDVLRIISEPTAAAFAYDLVHNVESNVERLALVFDLGGGTLGVTLLSFHCGVTEVLATDGNNHLGGSDFDHRLAKYLAREFDSMNNTDISSDSRALSRLRIAAERAKRILSSSKQTSIDLEALHKSIDFHTTVTRQTFEQCCTDLFEHTLTALDRLMLQAVSLGKVQKFQVSDPGEKSRRFDKSLIQDVVLVGGSSRIPKIQEIVSNYFGGKQLKRSINPDEAATFGASILAATLVGDRTSKAVNEKLLLDALSMSIQATYGLEGGSTRLACVVAKNTTIPTTKRHTLTTHSDNQTSIRVSVFEGEEDSVRQNLLLCELVLHGITPAPKGVPLLELVIELYHDYTIQFTLKEKGSDLSVTQLVDRSINPLSDKAIRGMKATLRSMCAEDIEDARRSVLRDTVESTANSVADRFHNLKLRGSVSSFQQEQIGSTVEKIITWLELNPRASFESCNAKLEKLEVLSKMAHRIESGIEEGQQSYQETTVQTFTEPHSGVPATYSPPPEDPESVTIRGPSQHQTTTPPILDSSRPMPIRETAATPPTSVEKRLGEFFLGLTSEERGNYSDQDLQDIAFLLRNTGRESWSRVPRIYTVLRRIGQLELLDEFVETGITDIFFPFTPSSLPDKLPPSVRNRFVDTQHIVLTEALEFERGSERRHANFGPGQTPPFEVIARLGSGGYGTVDKVVSTISHREYARKSFRRKKTFSKEKEDIKGFKSELKILKRLSHIHCVELIGSYTDPKFLALIMSPVADCNLAAYFSLAATSQDKLSLLRSFFGCLANALNYLHESKIRHRDIKPENILIRGSAVFLTDFGLSFDWGHLSRSTTTADSAKTPVYAAPEVAFFERRKNSSSDIWSLGCVFLEMMTVINGETVSAMRDFFKRQNDNYRYYDNVEAAQEWAAKIAMADSEEGTTPLPWISGMLQKDPDRRPTASSLYREILESDSTGRFCGTCCAFHGDDDSDITSDGEDPWADTMEETVRSSNI